MQQIGAVEDDNKTTAWRAIRRPIVCTRGYSSRQEGGQNINGPIVQWKPNIEAVKATIKFAKSTGRLHPKGQDEESREEEEAEE